MPTTPVRAALMNDVVVVDVTFEEMLRALVPLTAWGNCIAEMREHDVKWLQAVIRSGVAAGTAPKTDTTVGRPASNEQDLGRAAGAPVVRLRGRSSRLEGGSKPKTFDEVAKPVAASRTLAVWLHRNSLQAAVSRRPVVESISINRVAKSGINRSRTTVKADATARLFDIDATTIGWAVVDSGINARHPAFRKISARTGQPFDKPFEKTRTAGEQSDPGHGDL